MPVFNQIDLVCRSVDDSIAFYRLLGVKIPKSVIWGTRTGTHHVTVHLPNGMEIGMASQKLARVYNPGYKRNTDGGNLTIGFNVATRKAVDALHAKMTKAGYKSMLKPWDAFWGARYAIIADPDGNHVGIMSPSDPKKRYQGPDL